MDGGGKFSISPGSTFFDHTKNLESETMKNGMGRHDSLVAILNFGTNDLLQLWDAVTGCVCHTKFGSLKQNYCSTCIANSKIANSNSKIGDYKKQIKPREHYSENKATKKFKKINKAHKFVVLG